VANIDSVPSPALEVRDLRVVIALAQAGTTARAAEVLHLSQPAVSRALLALEERLGAQLFERTPRGLTLTSAGDRLVSAAGPLLVELRELERRVRTPVAAPPRLRVVCECYTAYHWLPSALQSMRKSLPTLELSLALEHTRDPVGALTAGEIDAALLTTAAVPRGPLRERPLFADEVVFVVGRTHPLARARTVTSEALQGQTILGSVHTPAAEHTAFMRRLFGRKRPKKLRFERLPLTDTILEAARGGLGIAVMSEWIASPHLGDDLVALRLDTGPMRRPWRLAYRDELGPIALSLHQALTSAQPRRGT